MTSFTAPAKKIFEMFCWTSGQTLTVVKTDCAPSASCRCAGLYAHILSVWRNRQNVIYVQLSLAAVSILPTCSNLSVVPPLLTRTAIRRLISRSNMAGGLETLQASTLLGPSYCGRCCHDLSLKHRWKKKWQFLSNKGDDKGETISA